MADEMDYHSEPARENETEASVVQSPFCGNLRSKKFFMMDKLPTEASDYLDGSNYCWCRLTQQIIGPDGVRVHPERCTAERGCYISALES